MRPCLETMEGSDESHDVVQMGHHAQPHQHVRRFRGCHNSTFPVSSRPRIDGIASWQKPGDTHAGKAEGFPSRW